MVGVLDFGARGWVPAFPKKYDRLGPLSFEYYFILLWKIPLKNFTYVTLKVSV